MILDVRTLLTQISSGDLESTARFLFPKAHCDDELIIRICHIVTNILSQSQLVTSADIKAIAKVHRDSHLSETMKHKIFNLYLGTISPSFIQPQQPLMKSLSAESKLLDTLERLPPNRIDITSVLDIIEIIDASNNAIPPHEIISIYYRYQPLFSGIPNAIERIKLLSLICVMSPIERIITLDKMVSIFSGLKYQDRVVFIPQFCKIPYRQRIELAISIIPFLKGITDGEQREKILQVIFYINPEKRIPILRAAADVTGFIKRGFEREVILDTLQYFSFEEIPPLLRELEARWNSLQEEVPRKFVLLFVHNLAVLKEKGLIPLMLIPSFLERACQNPLLVHNEDGELQLFIFFANHQDLLAQLHQSLMKTLEEETDPQIARQLAQYIELSEFILDIDEDHPLMQKVYEILIITDPSELPFYKNPYYLFRKLQQESLKRTNFKPAAQEVNGRVWRLDPISFQSQQLAFAERATFAHLPQGINFTTLLNLFSAFEERLHSLPSETQRQILKQIKANWEFNYASLRDNFVKDSYIFHLLSHEGQPTETAPSDVMQLRALVDHIHSLPDNRGTNELFSPREVALFALSSSVQSCPGGKREGISLAYRILKEQTHTWSPSATSKEHIQEYIQNWVQKLLGNLLSSESLLMYQLTGVPQGERIQQLSHQSIYVKNLLAKTIGYSWSLTFDRHTYTLYTHLVHLSQQAALTIFYSYLTPKQLACALINQINHDLRSLSDPGEAGSEARMFYKLLSSLIPADSTHWNLVEEEDEEGLPKSTLFLNEAGALYILEELGYITSTEAEVAS